MSTNIRSQLFRVIDVETTGLSPVRDRVVELGWAIMRGDGTMLSSDSTLVNPGCPIPADASRVHGIFDSDVANSPTLDEAVTSYPDLWERALPSVCHNASFDAAFLRQSPRFAEGDQRFICTMRLAENLIPNCDSYALDSLRVRLRLDVSGKPAAAHRAAADVASTCSLLRHLIDRYLRRWTQGQRGWAAGAFDHPANAIRKAQGRAALEGARRLLGLAARARHR